MIYVRFKKARVCARQKVVLIQCIWSTRGTNCQIYHLRFTLSYSFSVLLLFKPGSSRIVDAVDSDSSRNPTPSFLIFSAAETRSMVVLSKETINRHFPCARFLLLFRIATNLALAVALGGLPIQYQKLFVKNQRDPPGNRLSALWTSDAVCPGSVGYLGECRSAPPPSHFVETGAWSGGQRGSCGHLEGASLNSGRPLALVPPK